MVVKITDVVKKKYDVGQLDHYYPSELRVFKMPPA